MAARSLRAQLNQIRAWVREGRTDAWIAHQLEIPAAELRDFRRRHGLSPDSEPDEADDLRDEIEAEVEAATLAADDEEDEDDEEDRDEEDDEEDRDEEDDEEDRDEEDDEEDRDSERGSAEGGGKRRRRRRGGRGRRGGKRLEASFDHGETDGYGLWLDASVKDNPTYKEHWAGHSEVEVSIEPDQIVIRRSESRD